MNNHSSLLVFNEQRSFINPLTLIWICKIKSEKSKLNDRILVWPQLLFGFISTKVHTIKKKEKRIYANDHLLTMRSVAFFLHSIYLIVSISLLHMCTHMKMEFKIYFVHIIKCHFINSNLALYTCIYDWWWLSDNNQWGERSLYVMLSPYYILWLRD